MFNSTSMSTDVSINQETEWRKRYPSFIFNIKDIVLKEHDIPEEEDEVISVGGQSVWARKFFQSYDVVKLISHDGEEFRGYIAKNMSKMIVRNKLYEIWTDHSSSVIQGICRKDINFN